MLPVLTKRFCRFPFLFAVAAVCALTSPGRADEPAPHRKQVKYEIEFLQDMTDHHHMAVMMAELCEGRAIHAELLELCEEIIAAQTSEIETMQSWLDDWYGISYEPHMTRRGERQLESLAQLDGAEFEIAFMEMMIKHHRTAIKEGKACLKKAYHEDLIELCEDIIAVQSAEIALLEMWLDDWYGC